MDLMNGSLQLYLPPFDFLSRLQLWKLLRHLPKLLLWRPQIKADLLEEAISVPAESSEMEPEVASLSGCCFHFPAAYFLRLVALTTPLAVLHHEFLAECQV